MSSDYSSDEFIVGDHLKKKSSSSEESEYDYEEEEIKEKGTEEAKKDTINSNQQKDSKVINSMQKPFKKQVLNQKVQESYSSSTESEEEIYEVEEIVNHRTRKGKLQYFLKWVGYSSSENTWEFEDNLNCPDLIKDYWKKKGNEKVKKNELKMFQKKELEIRKQKFNEKDKSITKNKIEEKNEKTKSFNKSIARNSLAFHQIRFPFYDISTPKYRIQSINGYQIKDHKLIYNAILNNNEIISLTSNEIQKCDPNIILNYFEHIIEIE